jgi:signal transduction histidine kinase
MRQVPEVRSGLPPSPAAVPSDAPAMERLVAVVQELSMARGLATVQEIVRRAARELTGADGATFVLRDGEQCFYADEDAIAPLWKGKRFPMSACISGWAMLHRESVAIEDIYVDPRIPIDAYRPTFVRSLAMVPIRARQPIGAIGNYWAERHRITEEELRLLQALADSTSIAIENVVLLDELRAAKDRAEAACRLRDEFLGTVSHELRTPLNPILGLSSLIAEGGMGEAEVREAAEAISSSAVLQSRLVDDLLDVSKIISGTFRLETSLVPLVPAIEAAIESVASAAQGKGIRIEHDFDRDVGPVLADARRIQQVAWNLLSNAVKFTPAEGTVRISLERSPVDVKLVVSDTGEGIPPEFASHLFERFRQQDGSMSRSTGGMGLGLAMVRHLVEMHGGKVWASSPGKGLGSTFTVSFPVPKVTHAA